MKRVTFWVWILLALALACPAPIHAAEAADDGVLRVDLRSMGDRESVEITIEGSYSVDGNAGMRFARGAKMTVTAYDGALYLTCGSLTLQMGDAFTLTRHVTDGENGLYLTGSARGLLYEGDLQLSCEGSLVRMILLIDVESYLYGVVPYEMSDSFPLEALKAQAVAARTYALDRRNASANRDYDLNDTANDQVFMGYDAANVQARQAVEETRGVVGWYNDTYPTCFFTASNGGQTALPGDIWEGEGDFGYLARRDDPYDMQNERSVVKSYTLDADGAALDAALEDLLIASATEALAAQGYSDDPDDIRVTRLLSVETADPVSEGERRYRTLRVQFTVEGRRIEATQANATLAPALALAPESTAFQSIAPAPTENAPDANATDPEATPTPTAALVKSDFAPVDGSFTADLSIFDKIKPLLDLRINSGNFELFSVETVSDADGVPQSFTLSSRRYGHGVGMSQRGAQQMAGVYGKTYEEILAFYYPGMTLRTLVFDEAIRPALPELFSVTDEPELTLEEGECFGTVQLEGRATSLNVRSEPSTDSDILGQLFTNDVVVIRETLDSGWYAIRTNRLEGYVASEYVVR